MSFLGFVDSSLSLGVRDSLLRYRFGVVVNGVRWFVFCLQRGAIRVVLFEGDWNNCLGLFVALPRVDVAV